MGTVFFFCVYGVWLTLRASELCFAIVTDIWISELPAFPSLGRCAEVINKVGFGWVGWFS